jgi:hypothetical protein
MSWFIKEATEWYEGSWRVWRGFPKRVLSCIAVIALWRRYNVGVESVLSQKTQREGKHFIVDMDTWKLADYS